MSIATAAALMGGTLVTTGLAVAQTQATGTGQNGSNVSSWLPSTPDQWTLVVNATRTPTQEITRGIDYHVNTYQTVGGSQHSTELDVNLTDKNVRLGVVQSHDQLTDQDEILSSMAKRTGAVAGINGDFFEIYGSGRPLGMVVINGRLVKSPNAGWNQNLVVRADGSIAIGAESYSGTVADGAASHALTSVNTMNDLNSGGLVRITSDLGDSGGIPSSVVVSGHRDPSNAGILIVDSVTQNVNHIAKLPAGTEDLAGAGTSGQWLASTVHQGDHLPIAEKISPDNAPKQALSGGALLVQNGKLPVAGYAVDALGNPAAVPVRLSVDPSHLADISANPNGDLIIAGQRTGAGSLTARAGHVQGSVPLRVTDKLSSLAISPATVDLGNGATQQFSVSATTGDKQPVILLPSSVTWTVTPSSLGSVDPATGLFTAATTGSGLATVTARAAGATSSASVAVGQRAETIDPMTDVSNWVVNSYGGASGSISLSTSERVQPTDTGSMDVHYSIPAGQGVKQVLVWPKPADSFPPAGETQLPSAVGVWVKGSGTGGDGPPLSLGNLTLAESYTQVNGKNVNFYP